MKIGSLFSGIGGLELGLEMAGLGSTSWQVEQNEFCRNVLAKHWPKVKRIEDVKEAGKHNLEPVDLICGGFPCQDISSAGKGAGLSGKRSGLWFEFARIVEEMRPQWVIVENVASAASRWVDPVRADLERLSYETLPIPITAEDVGAPHRRGRVFLIAYSKRVQLREQPRGSGGQDREEKTFSSDLSETRGASCHANSQGKSACTTNEEMGVMSSVQKSAPSWPSPPSICRVDDGLPQRLDRNRSLGNSVVPQCAEVVGHIIKGLELERNI